MWRVAEFLCGLALIVSLGLDIYNHTTEMLAFVAFWTGMLALVRTHK